MNALPIIDITQTPTITQLLQVCIDAMLWGLLVGWFFALIRKGE